MKGSEFSFAEARRIFGRRGWNKTGGSMPERPEKNYITRIIN